MHIASLSSWWVRSVNQALCCTLILIISNLCNKLHGKYWPHFPDEETETKWGHITVLRVSSVQLLSHVWLFVTPLTAAGQAFLSIVHSRSLLKSCPLSWWCHPTISSSVIPFSSCFQSFPASGSSLSQFFISGSQRIGVWASASVHPRKIQDWFYLGWTGWISLQFKAPPRVFSNTTVQKHQFFSAHLSL